MHKGIPGTAAKATGKAVGGAAKTLQFPLIHDYSMYQLHFICCWLYSTLIKSFLGDYPARLQICLNLNRKKSSLYQIPTKNMQQVYQCLIRPYPYSMVSNCSGAIAGAYWQSDTDYSSGNYTGAEDESGTGYLGEWVKRVNIFLKYINIVLLIKN